jgi:hypothetical protein
MTPEKWLLRIERRYVIPYSDKSTRLAADDVLYLAALYAKDIRRTQSLTGLDLQGWLSPAQAYSEPMGI